MSETEIWTGRATVAPKANPNETLEEQCERLCKERGIEKSKYQDDYREALLDGEYKKWAVVEGVLWDLSGLTQHEDFHMCEATYNQDGSVEVALSFYNGGTYLEEQFNEALEAAKQKQAA